MTKQVTMFVTLAVAQHHIGNVDKLELFGSEEALLEAHPYAADPQNSDYAPTKVTVTFDDE